MSSGLMSCVRENSPPLELDRTEAVGGGPMSLPMAHDVSVEVIGECKPTAMTSTTSLLPPTMTGNADGGVAGGAPNAEQQKRRRFHPLRNLRRIFRRRTITSVTDAPAATRTNTLPASSSRAGSQAVNSTSEKNLRSATLTSSMSSAASASSPSSPLTHQQLQDAYNTQSLPKSKSYATSTQLQRDVLLLGGKAGARGKLRQTLEHESHGESSTDYDDLNNVTNRSNGNNMYTATTTTSVTSAYHNHHHHHHQHHHLQHQQTTQQIHQTPQRLSQSIGVAVLPPIGGGGGTRGRSFFTERQKLRSIGDSTNELDSTDTDRRLDERSALHNGSSNSGEITDSQRSLSEGRLVDSDFSREGLSQSHDSVFSESATASSLSIVLRAELADVLRKRRTRPDGSDEDLGLPRSPGSPQRRAEQLGHNAKPSNSAANNTNQSGEVSSVSLLSMTSNECDDFQATSTANNSLESQQQQQHTERSTTRYTRSATFSSMPTEILRHPTMSMSFTEATAKDEVDLFSSDWQRLSHSAAKHKMAIRPAKKNVPTRQHRRTLESTIPEANEDAKQASNVRLNVSDGDVKAKTRSLPPGVNAKILEQQAAQQPPTVVQAINSSTSLDIKTSVSSTATLCNTSEFTATSTPKANKPMLLSETCTSSTKISSASHAIGTKIFGTRVFSNKTTTNSEPEPKKEEPTTTAALETNENGFLRRLIHRNSKRNYAKANTADELDKNVVSEPKKIPVSTSCFEMTTNTGSSVEVFAPLDKAKSALSYQQSIEETRKGIKREIMNEGKGGLSAILNNFMIAPERTTVSAGRSEALPTTTERAKPKSGPAARQRYVPQEIMTSEKPTTISVSIPEQEVFQSTTIIRDITAKQSPTKDAGTPSHASPHHHFEKKAKIVGLSAFQQKISRSNDSVVRLSNSSNSLETSTDDDLSQSKQRKSVEKSRSFRTYNEEQRDSTTVRQNMPSMPDLTLNLRVPNYTQQFILQEKEYSSPSPPEPDKCASLGFEINDNTLLQPHVRGAESSSNITSVSSTGNASVGNYKRSFIVTTNTSSRLLNSNTVAPHLSPSNSCQADISEIEQNIDMIVKSPFISVIRKSANLEEVELKHEQKEEKRMDFKEFSTESTNPWQSELKRPTTLSLKEKTKSEEYLRVTPSTPTTPTTAGVSLRVKSQTEPETQSSSVLDSPKVVESARKSAPNSFKYMQRNSSSNDTTAVPASTAQTQAQPQPQSPARIHVPEFMKIQLNHIDQARFMGKSNVVLAKNIKETAAATSKSESVDSIPRRLSDDNVIITEQPLRVAQTKLPASKTPSPTNVEKKCEQPSPKSPTKCPAEDESVVLRPKADVAVTPNKLSLQERKRLFMAEAIDKQKVEKKIEELRNERKKSMSEEVFRKLSTCGRPEDKPLERRDSAETPPTTTPAPSVVNSPMTTSPVLPTSPTGESVVVLRKKSFGISSSNGNNNNGNSNSNNVRKDDSTPELMKVFARRSLKVKDEDLTALADKLHSANANATSNQQTVGKKTISVHQNLDSDKENQSSSEEKLHKLSVDLEQMTSVTKVTNPNLHVTSMNSVTNNRNSVADFRNNVMTKNISNSNNNNNNNAINNSSNNKSHLPPIKVSNGFRGSISNGSSTVERKLNGTSSQNVEMITTIQGNSNNSTNHNNNNNNISYHHQTNTAKRQYERQSFNLRTMESSNSDAPPGTTAATTMATTASKPIERSATVGEFKGIHQRRAEWEQRAKEALK